MNPIEALEYLERVVETDADVDPGIHEAIAVLSATLEREQRMATALECIADTKFKTFGTEWVRAMARGALEGHDEISSG